MKPLVTLALACALFSGVYALICYEGSPGQWQEKECLPSQTKCATRVIFIEHAVQYENGSHTGTDTVAWECATEDECASTSLVNIRAVKITVICCDTARCNYDPKPELPKQSPNGNKCFTCVGEDCTKTLECNGSEDHCIKSTVSSNGQTMAVKGCASLTACSGTLNANLWKALADESVDLHLKADLNCCKGNLCNSALRIGQHVIFLLLVPLASFIFFN